MSPTDLSDDQIAAARAMYGLGRSLGEIAARLKCSVYDLSPWLYTERISTQGTDSTTADPREGT